MYSQKFTCETVYIYKKIIYLKLRPMKKEMEFIQKDYHSEWFCGCVGPIYYMKIAWKNFHFYEKKKYKNLKERKISTISVKNGLI